MKYGLMNLYLLWGTIQDLKEKKISLVYLKIGLAIGILFLLEKIIGQKLAVVEVFLSFVPGIIFLLLGKMSKEKIGFGDGWLFLIIACWMETKEIWILWQVSLSLCSIFSIVMLMAKKFNTKYCIPFIPFVWLAHLLFLIYDR